MSDDLADLRRLDRALDELAVEAAEPPTREPEAAADRDGTPTVELNGHRPARPEAGRPAEPDGQQGGSPSVEDLLATAAGLSAAVPAPSPEAAAAGREAFLASADAFIGSRRHRRRRKLLLRATALAAALLLVGIPGALARQALPGSPLYPVREATQDARLALTSSPVSKARILLDDAERLRDEAIRTKSSRDRCIRAGQAEVNQALDELRGLTGAAAERQWIRAQSLLDDFRDLAEGKLPGQDHSGPGRGGGDDRSGSGGGDDSGGDSHGGSGSSGSGSSGSGSSGSGSSGDSGSGDSGSQSGSGSIGDDSGSGSVSGSGSGSGSSDDGSGSGSGGSGSGSTSSGSGSTSDGGSGGGDD
jgi:hypothetical protein